MKSIAVASPNYSYVGSSTYLAFASFLIGTAFLLLRYVFRDSMEIVVGGFFYVLLATLVNSIVLLNLLYHFITKPKKREIFAIKMLILLANIPIAAFYFFVVISIN